MDVAGGFTNTVTADANPNRYWILQWDVGLILLQKTGEDWGTYQFPIGNLRAMAGPDSDGRLYCTRGGDDPGLTVFDCDDECVVDSVSLPYYVRGVALSDDETKLYVCASLWPPTTEPEFDENRNYRAAPYESGLVLEIDVATLDILRSAVVDTMPNTIYYSSLAQGDKLTVNAGIWHLRMYKHEGMSPDRVWCTAFVLTQIVDVATFQIMEPSIESRINRSHGTNALTPWPDDDSVVAFCNTGAYDYDICVAPEDFSRAIRLIDPSSCTVVSSVPIRHANGEEVGIVHFLPNCLNPDELYVTVQLKSGHEGESGFWLIVVDKYTGAYLRSVDLGDPEIVPYFMAQSPCGELIVTARKGIDGKILIVEPENHTPECCLEVVTPMPYIGPAPALIEFDATGSYDPDACDELTYEWDFDGDGLYGEPVDDSYTGDPDNPTHSYTASYHGPVMLRLSDNHGSEMTCTVYIDVDII